MKKMAMWFTQCLLAGGMIYAIVVLTAVPARAAGCNCTIIAREAGAICYNHGFADGPAVPEDGYVIECDSTSYLLQCEYGIYGGGCQ